MRTDIASRSTGSPKLQAAVLPSCSAVGCHPTPAVRLQDLSKYTTVEELHIFCLGFGMNFWPLYKGKKLPSPPQLFPPFKFPPALFLRPGWAQLVLLLEEDHRGLFFCYIPHQVILLSVGLHLPFYTPKVVASSFREISCISVGLHAQITTG